MIVPTNIIAAYRTIDDRKRDLEAAINALNQFESLTFVVVLEHPHGKQQPLNGPHADSVTKLAREATKEALHGQVRAAVGRLNSAAELAISAVKKWEADDSQRTQRLSAVEAEQQSQGRQCSPGARTTRHEGQKENPSA
jgi:hypothetical protein